MGRLAGKVAWITGAAFFLASDDSSFVTGVALPVDGGYTAGHSHGMTTIQRFSPADDRRHSSKAKKDPALKEPGGYPPQYRDEPWLTMQMGYIMPNCHQPAGFAADPAGSGSLQSSKSFLSMRHHQ